MFKNYIHILLTLSFSILNIFSSSIFKINRQLQENSEEIINLNFKNAKNLTYIESRWSFGIEYSGKVLSNTTKYFVAILIKGHPSIASCGSADNYILNCIIGEDGQKETDLIQINSEFTTGANIKWNDLPNIYDIPINTTLKYKDSYDLKYDYSQNYLWEFKVKITDDSILPESGKVVLDLYFDSNTIVFSSCNHLNYMLYCSFHKSKGNKCLIKIPPTKFSGSIEWENLDDNITIPLYYEVNTYFSSGDLEFIDNQWTYSLSVRSDTSIAATGTLITINTKIIRNEGEFVYFTKCFSKVASYNFLCTVYGENQNSFDLVYISNSEDNDVSIKWGKINPNVNIERKATLSFKRIYDVVYVKNWTFKIDIGENELPNKAKVSVEVRSNKISHNYLAPCDANNNILDCSLKSGDLYLTDSFMLYSGKILGISSSVTWKNDLKMMYIKIPLNFNFTFVNASSAIFTDKWNFMVFGKPLSSNPKNSSYLIDIIQNGQEITAFCQTPASGSKLITIGLFCYSNAEKQSETDTIKINVNKKYGSIVWDGGIDNTNNDISKVSQEHMYITLTYIRVYLDYHIHMNTKVQHHQDNYVINMKL